MKSKTRYSRFSLSLIHTYEADVDASEVSMRSSVFFWSEATREARRSHLKVKVREKWVRQIYKQREKSGIFHNLVREMALGDREFYFK